MAGPYSYFGPIKAIAQRGLRNQKKEPGDFVGDDGLLYCGICLEPKQKYIMIADPTPEDHDRESRLLVVASCKCEKDREEQERKAKLAQEEMRKLEGLRAASLMDSKFYKSTFDRFKATKYNARNLKICQRYATNFEKMMENNQGLIMWGDVGTGKSYAAACIANYLLDRNIPVIMTSFVKIMEKIDAGGELANSIIDRLCSVQLVIFDDLGAERNTSFAIEKVFGIIDTRYRKQLPMILTTNLTIEEMKSETETKYQRIYDRIFEICYPMQFTGPSWRRIEANSRFIEMRKFLDDDAKGVL